MSQVFNVREKTIEDLIPLLNVVKLDTGKLKLA
jgi:hypothetical protein